MRIITAALVALTSGLALSTASLAQMVVPVEGKLSMNSGTGFRDVAGPVNGKVGGSVMAGASSSGQIVYQDGCQVAVVPGRVFTITAVSPCKNASGQASTGQVSTGQASPGRALTGPFAGQPIEPVPPTPPPPPPPAPRPPPPPISP